MSSSVLRFEDCDEDTLKRLRHRGRANRCNTCLADDGKTVIMEKGRMEAHIYKEHVAPAMVPFRCTLCQFRCQDRKTLDDHVLNYKPHVKAVKAAKSLVPDDCLKESSHPYFVSEEDYHVFSLDESARIWFEQKQKKAGSRDSLSFLYTAVADTFGSQTELQSVLPPLTQSGSVPGNDSTVTVATQPQPSSPVDSTVQLISSLLNSGLLQLGPGFDVSCLQSQVKSGSEDGQKDSSSFTVTLTDKPTSKHGDATVPPMHTCQTPVQDEEPIPPNWSPATAFKATLQAREKDAEGPTELAAPIDLSVTGAQKKGATPARNIVPSAAHGSPPPKSTPCGNDEALDLTTSNGVTEDLRSQLLEEVPPIDEDDTRHVRASSVLREELFLAASPATSCTSSSSSSSSFSSVVLELKKQMEDTNRTMAAEINNNSRA